MEVRDNKVSVVAETAEHERDREGLRLAQDIAQDQAWQKERARLLAAAQSAQRDQPDADIEKRYEIVKPVLQLLSLHLLPPAKTRFPRLRQFGLIPLIHYG